MKIPLLIIIFSLTIVSCKKKKQVNYKLPTVITNEAVWNLDTINWNFSINFTGLITNKGVGDITESGVIISENPINISTSYLSYTFNLPAYSDSIINVQSPQLKHDQLYYYRAYVKNNAGYSYGAEKTINTITVGTNYGGGTIFYIFNPGDHGYVQGEFHGIISSKQDLGIYNYGCLGTNLYTGPNDSREIGYAEENTTAIRNSCGSNTGGYKCYNLNKGGYIDWWMPTVEELQLMFLFRDEIGGFNISPALDDPYTIYLSSSAMDYNNAWDVDFTFNSNPFNNDFFGVVNHRTSGVNKSTLRSIRPIRYF